MKYSIIVPVYKNELSLHRLIDTLEIIAQYFGHDLEVVFVVDGSPDNSFNILKERLKGMTFNAQLIAHSRNFGALAAVRTGLSAAQGNYFAMMAADLQEPPSLIEDMLKALAADECDVAIGIRQSRNDPIMSQAASNLFWYFYRKFIIHDMPKGGVDSFACNVIFREKILQLEETHSSLVALIFWLGFRRKLIPYDRLARREGKSAWTLTKKVNYMMDSIFSFTDMPIRLLLRIGIIGLLISIFLTVLILVAKLSGSINVPGYAATMLVVLFFGALNTLGLGLVGNYAWRGYENTKHRPNAVVALKIDNYTRSK